MPAAKIASIHWFSLTARRRYRGKAYDIQSVDLNAEPRILITNDLFEHDEGAHIPGTNQRQKYQNLVKGEEIARCLVGEWTGTTVVGVGMNPQRHPGVWVVRDRLPVSEVTMKHVGGEDLTAEEKMVVDAAGNQVFRPASQEELREMWEEDLLHARMSDRAYAEWCWNEGNRIYQAWQHGSKEPVPREMPPLYKAAARHYGLDAEWLKEAASTAMKQCDHCDNMIRKDAMICGKCLEPNDLKKWAKWKIEKEAAMQAALESKTAPEKVPAAIHSGKGISNHPQAQV
jgi:hypothetical protein